MTITLARNKFSWRKILAFASDILQKLPNRSDGVLAIIVKSLSIVDSFNVQMNWGSRPEPSADFWHTKGFNFERALEVLWDKFHGRIHLGIT